MRASLLDHNSLDGPTNNGRIMASCWCSRSMQCETACNNRACTGRRYYLRWCSRNRRRMSLADFEDDQLSIPLSARR